MKNTLAQLQLHISKIDPRTWQLVYLAFALAIALIRQSPSEGPGGIR
jgi:hypothetical protein